MAPLLKLDKTFTIVHNKQTFPRKKPIYPINYDYHYHLVCYILYNTGHEQSTSTLLKLFSEHSNENHKLLHLLFIVYKL